MGQFVILGATLLSTGASIAAQRKATGSQEVELKLAQRQEDRASRDREVQRKRRLAAILGSQAANAAAGGVANSGSISNISIVDAQRAGEESRVDDLNTRTRIDALKRQRNTISNISNLRTATTIFKGAERFAAR